MEIEVNVLHRRYSNLAEKNKSLKQCLKIQNCKSRQLIVACGFKLQEKEEEIKGVR